MSIPEIASFIGLLCSLITIGTLIYKYSQVVAKVNEHETQIKEIKENQKVYQELVVNSLKEINNTLTVMNDTLAILKYKIELIENGKLLIGGNNR